MTDNPDATLAKKHLKETDTSTAFTSSAVTERSTSPKDVLALGQQIVKELNLNARGEVLAQWLAHHVAELIRAAETAEGDAKVAAQERAITVIMKLWARRRNIPGDVDPLASYQKAIQVLSRLAPGANPWRQYRHTDTYPDLLSQSFEALRMVVVAGVLLTQVDRARPLSAEEGRFLESEETALHASLEGWISFLAASSPQQEPESSSDSPDDAGEELGASEENKPVDPDNGDDESNKAGIERPEALHAALLTHLERAHENLGLLINRWKKTAPPMGPRTADEEFEEPDSGEVD